MLPLILSFEVSNDLIVGLRGTVSKIIARKPIEITFFKHLRRGRKDHFQERRNSGPNRADKIRTQKSRRRRWWRTTAGPSEGV